MALCGCNNTPQSFPKLFGVSQPISMRSTNGNAFGLLTAEAFAATNITVGDLTVSNTATIQTLVADTIVVTNTLYATNSLVGPFGTLALSTNVSIAMSAGVYTNVGFNIYDYRHSFGSIVLGTESITNLVAGDYLVELCANFAGAGATSVYEGYIFTNNVRCTMVGWALEVTTTVGSASFSTVLALPANCRTDYRIVSPDSETAVFWKLSMTMMGAN